MSIKKIFTIVDKISEKAGNVFTVDTLAEAERQFFDALKNAAKGSLFESHPQDFSLVLMGDFDDKTYSISNTQTTVVAVGKPNLSEVQA